MFQIDFNPTDSSAHKEVFFTCAFLLGFGVNHESKTSYHKASAVRIIFPTLYAERIFSKIISGFITQLYVTKLLHTSERL